MGRSCILVSIAGKNVMLDCGMHMGFNDDVRGIGAWRGPLTELAGGYSKISMADSVWSIASPVDFSRPSKRLWDGFCSPSRSVL